MLETYPVIFGGISIGLGLYFWVRSPKGTVKRYFAKTSGPASSLQNLSLLGLAALCLNIGTTTFLGRLFPQFNPAQSTELRDLMKDLFGKILVLVLTLVFAPIVEEVLFRGFLVDGFLSIGNRTNSAIFLSALFFALCHGLTQIPGVILFAMCLGLLRFRAGSLKPTMFVHACNNLFGISMLYFQWTEPSYLLAGILLTIGIASFYFSRTSETGLAANQN